MIGQIVSAFSKNKANIHQFILYPQAIVTIVSLVSTGGKHMHYLMFHHFFFGCNIFYEPKPNVYEDFPCEESTLIALL